MTRVLKVCIIALLCLGQNVTASNENLSSSYDAPVPTKIQRVRIDFVTPIGFTRHLLLAFTPDDAASDGIDYGYDATNTDNLPDDLNWMIGDGRYIIQGVGSFDESKTYPLGMFLSNDGSIKIKLDELENFEKDIDVFILDKQEDTYTKISEFDYDAEMTAGDYTDRFYIAFSAPDKTNEEGSTLSDSENSLEVLSVSYQKSNKTLKIVKPQSISKLNISLFDISGRTLIARKNVSDTVTNLKVTEFTNQPVLLSINSDNSILTKKILLN